MSDHATYLYCIVHARKAPPLARAPRGLPGMRKVRQIEVGQGLWIVCADAPLAKFGAAAIEAGLKDMAWVSRCALAHEAVIEHFGNLTGTTVVPMKLFTLFDDDMRAAAHVGKLGRKLQRVITAIAGKREWGVRLRYDERRARAEIREGIGRAASQASGAAFLLAKKQQKDAEAELGARARMTAGELHDTLSALAADARTRTPPAGAGATVLLDAVYLVASGKTRPFQTAVRTVGKSLAQRGYEIALTGPWPPYHFVGVGT